MAVARSAKVTIPFVGSGSLKKVNSSKKFAGVKVSVAT